VVIVGVRQGSPAEDASLQKGDLVLEVNRHPVKTAEEMQERIKKSDKTSLLLLVQRGDGTLFVVLKAEK
jgi:S1-C subfamily serine protease